ncbi:unnamed protein product, partial [marine sediment metagenome]
MKDFLNKLASDSPTPGGGSASAASGAMGAALLSMVYSISRRKIIKTLEVIKKLNEEHPIEIVSTFLGAHAFPEEYKNKEESYVNLIIEE